MADRESETENRKPAPIAAGRVVTLDELLAERRRLRAAGGTFVFTNGCFDLLHRGHLEYLAFARSLGDVLAVGLNSDDSVRRNKGPLRPIANEADRALMLCSLRCVDYVIVFDADTPQAIIEALSPDVLVKGGDWAHHVVGREFVEAHGGRVVLADVVAGCSTTNLIERVLQVYGGA